MLFNAFLYILAMAAVVHGTAIQIHSPSGGQMDVSNPGNATSAIAPLSGQVAPIPAAGSCTCGGESLQNPCFPVSYERRRPSSCYVQFYSSDLNRYPRQSFGTQLCSKQWQVSLPSESIWRDLVLRRTVTELHTHTHSITEKR